MSLRKGLEAAMKGFRMVMPPATTVVTSTPAPGRQQSSPLRSRHSGRPPIPPYTNRTVLTEQSPNGQASSAWV
ncbi:hypothetical protein I79_019212 [Cricetulus griseus]|uniref:Uncharacterized protein n=1 Tax=Cricetulus griseus TaxID=10029 RepID=G3I6T4_CRIGR|nr:hypothetical protein I79_019212 [Cricetulus griseus]